MRKAYQICTAALASFVLVTSGCNIVTGNDKKALKELKINLTCESEFIGE